jgi:CO/xanthine dehydrogenase FAD-binding subunit
VDVPVDRVLRPADLDQALAALAAEPDARVIAGGTDLMVQLRDGRRKASALVDLGRVGLTWIVERENALEIGAGTPMDAIADSPAVRRRAPALAVAAAQIGAWPIQCRATLGGNLANASPAADTAPPLLVADARVELVSSTDRRSLPLHAFFVGPGRTALRPGELIRAVVVPALGAAAFERFLKVGPRREQIISTVSLALRARRRRDAALEGVRIAVGAAGPVPLRARSAEAALEGRRPDPAARREALHALQHDLSPIDDVRAPADYRRLAAAALLDRFLREAGDG